MRLSDENLRGKTIIAADGKVVGKIAAIFLETDTMQVESIQIQLGQDMTDNLAADRALVGSETLDIPVRLIQSVGDTVVLSVPVVGLREVMPSAREVAEGAAH